ncbi:MFS transporter [Ideonella sp. YS5]|uniref:MFS transporter n=1 Tax=Ideonella sp. YS5 TaxID=3453714 RepID=UPI003EECDD9C
MTHIGRPPCDAGAILHPASGEAAASPPCSAAGRRWTMLAAILGSGMAFADGTVVNVALPALQRTLGATASEAQWVIEAYALLLSALLLVGGALGDRYGRRRIFMIGVAIFAAASLACALSATPGQLIAARAVQGLGAALLVPGSLSLISANHAESERGAAIGTWSAFSGITAAIGPVLGGYLIDHASWTWAFLMNLPIGVALLLMQSRVPESRGGAAGAQRPDVAGALLATIGLAGLVFALVEAPGRGWMAPVVLAAGLGGIAGLVLFIVVEARSREPMLPLSLFRNRHFSATNLLTLLLYAALGGGLYFVPLNLIQVQGYGATAAGAAMLPFIAIMFLLSRWAGRLVDRWGPRRPLVLGPAIAALGFVAFALPGVGGRYVTTILPAMGLLGLGMAITVAPLTTTVMNSVGEARAGIASGVNNAVSRAAGLLAVAVLGVLMAARFEPRLEHELEMARLPPAVVQAVWQQRDRLAAVEAPTGTQRAAADQVKQAVGKSFIDGYRAVMLACAALALLGAGSAALLIRRSRT